MNFNEFYSDNAGSDSDIENFRKNLTSPAHHKREQYTQWLSETEQKAYNVKSTKIKRICVACIDHLKVCQFMYDIYWGTKVWNIEINFILFKNKEKDKSKNLCLVKFGVLGYQNTQK